MHILSTFGARTSHGQIQIHKIHHGPDLRKPPPSPYSILCASPWGQHPNGILLGVPKFPKLGLLRLWGPITFCVHLWLRWGLKQSCNPHWELSNGMSYATCTQENQGDSRLLVVGSQIVNSTPGPSFGHNMCFRCPNGSCEPISDIYVPRAF